MCYCFFNEDLLFWNLYCHSSLNITLGNIMRCLLGFKHSQYCDKLFSTICNKMVHHRIATTQSQCFIAAEGDSHTPKNSGTPRILILPKLYGL